MRESMRASEGGECDRNESEELKTNIFLKKDDMRTHSHIDTQPQKLEARLQGLQTIQINLLLQRSTLTGMAVSDSGSVTMTRLRSTYDCTFHTPA